MKTVLFKIDIKENWLTVFFFNFILPKSQKDNCVSMTCQNDTTCVISLIFTGTGVSLSLGVSTKIMAYFCAVFLQYAKYSTVDLSQMFPSLSVNLTI